MPRQPLDYYPDPSVIACITFVPFLPSGDCALILDTSDGLRLPAGDVHPGEHYLDAAVRVPLETAGIKMQRFHPFALDGDHLYAWIDGDRYDGWRPHARIERVTGPAERLVESLRSRRDRAAAAIVEEAVHSFRTQSDEAYYAGNLRMLERAYLAAKTPQGGSGFGRDAASWRKAREHIVDGLDRDGSFLDLGCANGLLMESITLWASERGLPIEPYGVDISPALVDLARRRMPMWETRLWAGNAIDWIHPRGHRFDFVHTLLDLVPVARRADLLTHCLGHLVTPGGRLLISQYNSGNPEAPAAADIARELGFTVAGQSRPQEPAFSARASVAWIDLR
jgi:2-polyprenyl-3-methyl-5-hydroxy-6-metoxy-1,4-benzoquinol methylase